MRYPIEVNLQSISEEGTPLQGKFTISDFMKVSKEALDFQLNALYPLKVGKDPVRSNLVFLNHDRNFSTFLTIRYLAEHERVADIYTLSRSMFESTISMGLLAKHLIADDITRYQEFQYVEIYKTYTHLKKLRLENLSGLSVSDARLVSERRANYIAKWGRDISSWTGKPLEENVKLIDSAYPPTCNENHFYEYLYCQVYRKGSQSAHSSFAGLSKGVDIEAVSMPELATTLRFSVNKDHLIFSCFHSILVFLSSVRFLGCVVDKQRCESYFQEIAHYIISEN